ncbi:MAG: hypothetical protein RL008_533, partial [Actinomycetota bacterium]
TGAWGEISLNAKKSSFSKTLFAGIIPFTILQNKQSLILLV